MPVCCYAYAALIHISIIPLMVIRRLEITDVRNIRQAGFIDLAPINILYGLNGSGKTSVLEAIHLLSSARSFRSHKLKPLINKNAEQCVVYGEVCSSPQQSHYSAIGVQRSRKETGVIKVDGSPVRSTSVLAEKLPLQVINADTFLLLEGSPSVRRQFVDWGVFHVEHSFHAIWKTVQRCLKQRNSLLRHGRIIDGELDVWTDELVKASEQLDSLRKAYLTRFSKVFEVCLTKLIKLDGVTLSYQRGWDKDRCLAEVLSANKEKEKEQGYTASGPHRADLRLRYQGHMAADILSRGQQKLVVCALRVAQGYLLSELTQRRCVYLIDDLPAELDNNHRRAFCELLSDLDCQVFITCVDHSDLDGCGLNPDLVKLFHVEHGSISAGQ